MAAINAVDAGNQGGTSPLTGNDDTQGGTSPLTGGQSQTHNKSALLTTSNTQMHDELAQDTKRHSVLDVMERMTRNKNLYSRILYCGTVSSFFG